MNERTVLAEDGTGRKKLKVSLPGGRYQLSLDDGAVSLLCDTLGYETNDFIPEPFVPLLVATGDAWFPRQRDTEQVVEDLPADGSLTNRQREALIGYLKTVRISPKNASLAKAALDRSPVSDAVDPEDLQINELPSIPDGIDLGGESPPKTQSQTRSDDGAASTSSEPPQATTSPRDEAHERSVEETDLPRIPGIGSHRAEKLLKAGYTSVAQIADSRPSDIDHVNGISEQLATVAVEGAREVLGYEQSTATRLASETGIEEETFDAALSTLAASGVPPSEASPVLRVLYGPSLVDIGALTGQQAYYLWDDGYRTPFDVASATLEELCEVPYIGEKTAVAIRDEARAIGSS
ncbi:helix-hairpin-helix domain-containing protein [Halobacteria archaeon AArc-m2/3/4]|uniref:Helix-hairpin-helix domain-containing protein n=1 Tax=Natronoglomus mannanivorans TaxID=2979990 RepID=A0ABT2QLL3_9EURY|nr:helix-hairpin-helix domain-containing protein [Halobacteria archaeon AArc-m2/3/4]